MNARLDRARRRLVKLSRVLRDRERFLGTTWCLWKSTAFEPWARELDSTLWGETLDISNRIYRDAARAIAGLPITGGQPGVIGGGGCDVRKLYFLARYTKPEVIVETGVSAGYSSRAFLEAIQANGFGRLYSSDLPIHLTEEQVVCIVPDPMRENWELYYEVDDVNIPHILNRVETVDLFHYDSDKSVSAKEHVVGMVLERMTSDGLIIIDDIDRDAFFRKFSACRPTDSIVFRNVGVIGIPRKARSRGPRE